MAKNCWLIEESLFLCIHCYSVIVSEQTSQSHRIKSVHYYFSLCCSICFFSMRLSVFHTTLCNGDFITQTCSGRTITSSVKSYTCYDSFGTTTVFFKFAFNLLRNEGLESYKDETFPLSINNASSSEKW